MAHAQYHLTYLQGVDINHIFETRDPYLSIYFATFMALRRRLTSVIHKNSVQPIKAKNMTAHAPYHVTIRTGSKTTTDLEFTTHIWLFTMTLLRGSDEE